MPQHGSRTEPPVWIAWLGVAAFVAAASAGYFYNLTFVQLGLVDLGTRVLGMPSEGIAGAMALLAGATLVVALTAGLVMHHRKWSADFMFKVRLLALVVLLQTGLTAVAPQLRDESALTVWILAASVSLGLGVPSLFGLTCDLVPVQWRGAAAAVAASGAFLTATVFSSDWRIDQFAAQLLWLMVPGAVVLAAAAFLPSRVMALLAVQHLRPQYGVGRFSDRTRMTGRWPGRAFSVALVLMFGVYFIDSLGFIRLVDHPAYMGAAWHSNDVGILWAIGLTHVLAAALAGILYPALPPRVLLGWVFAVFALSQLSYVLHTLTTPESPATLGMPLLYAVPVSIYTVLNFALWADFSTPATIARNTALGVGISGWLASFLSTSLALWWAAVDLPFTEHLRAVAAISLLLLIATALLLLLFPEVRRRRTTHDSAR